MRPSRLASLAGAALALAMLAAGSTAQAQAIRAVPGPGPSTGLGVSGSGVFGAAGGRYGPMSTLRVTVTISAACSVSRDAALAFPAWRPGDAAIDAKAAIAIDCSAGLPYLVAFDRGAAPSATGRRLSGSDTNAPAMPYQLYSDPDRRSVWGDRPGVDTLGGHGTGAPVAIPVYGRAAPPPRGRPATYQDLVRLTVAY